MKADEQSALHGAGEEEGGAGAKAAMSAVSRQ